MTVDLPALVYHECYSELILPPLHRYPIGKYRTLYQRLRELGVPAEQFSTPSAIMPSSLAVIHDPQYIQSLCEGTLDPKAMRRIGFPWSQQLISRSLTSTAGTLLAAELALAQGSQGLAIHLSGGYHHAFYDVGSGFCLFNDLAFTAATLQQRGVGPILIFDLDVHQGDGTAQLFSENRHIITASIHCEKNFPARKQHSDWDIGLDRNCSDAAYLEAVSQSLTSLLSWHKPELVIYDAGVDVHHADDLGLLNLSTATIAARDELVLSLCQQQGIPVAAVIGGGYQRDLDALTQVHLQLFKAAFTVKGSPLGSKIKS
ncbi:histone deacetylase family protein [Alishewanella tabrizica]|uniref:Histone deacetylase n=1 Tax=Alishewanella tabrizica TaxID=671278 RepID=A0ABQ2WEE4_9ALTE|nr:histone deacetylase [Alishewanella tabrizica]GGW51214.1 histone deacetylase [Alishewanella tabrizica]